MIRKKQSQIISYFRKSRLISSLFLVVFLSLILIPSSVRALPPDLVSTGANAALDAVRVDLKYTPNVPIPITVGGINFAGENVITDGTFLAKYIVAIYTFGAGFAGIVAMLMLVIAGWKWLMAGGNAQKIIEAKGTITGALLGLAILFGGQLLLRQISENFASIQSLDIETRDLREGPIEDGYEAGCAQIVAEFGCGSVWAADTDNPSPGDPTAYCVGHKCSGTEQCVYTEGNTGGFTVGTACATAFNSANSSFTEDVSDSSASETYTYLRSYYECICE